MEDKKSTDSVRIRFQFTRTEYAAGVREYLRRTYTVSWIQLAALLLAAAAVAALFLIVGPNLLNTFVLVLLALVCLCVAYLYFWAPGRSFDHSPGLGGAVSFVFTLEDIGRQDEQTAAILDWRVKQFLKSRAYYFLLEGKGDYLMLPRRAFSGPEEERRFQQMVLEANPAVRFRDFS